MTKIATFRFHSMLLVLACCCLPAHADEGAMPVPIQRATATDQDDRSRPILGSQSQVKVDSFPTLKIDLAKLCHPLGGFSFVDFGFGTSDRTRGLRIHHENPIELILRLEKEAIARSSYNETHESISDPDNSVAFTDADEPPALPGFDVMDDGETPALGPDVMGDGAVSALAGSRSSAAAIDAFALPVLSAPSSAFAKPKGIGDFLAVSKRFRRNQGWTFDFDPSPARTPKPYAIGDFWAVPKNYLFFMDGF